MAIILGSMLAEVAVAVATCLVALYLYLMSKYNYWSSRGVPYMKPTPIVGNTYSVTRKKDTMPQFLKKVYDSNPDKPVVGLYNFKSPFLMARSLDVVRNILVKDAGYFIDRSIGAPASEKNPDLFSRCLFALKGKKWRHMRVKLTPTFTSGKIKKMFYLINECGKELLHCIDKEMSEKQSVQVKETVARYSTDVIASCAFGVDANALADPNAEFRTTMKKVFEFTGARKISMLLGMVGLHRLGRLLMKTSGGKDNMSIVNTFVRKTFWDVVEHRKQNGVVRKDFVDILMQMKDEGEVRAEDAKDLEEIKHDSRYMDEAQIKADKADIKLVGDDFVAQAFIFIIAGEETSSTVVSFTLLELSLHADIQDRLRREIQSVLDKHNSQVTYEAIAEMEYLDMVVSETMRKYPTVGELERKCTQDYRIPGTEITVEKETSVNIPVLAIHWDPSIYPQPEKFDPERFTPENKKTRPSYTYLPFGEGPRICIGMRFGLMQVKTALVHILTYFDIKPSTDSASAAESRDKSSVPGATMDIVLTFHKIK